MARRSTIYDHDTSTSAPLWLLREEIKAVNVSGNQPLWLDDPKSVWIISAGKVDVFAVQMQDGRDVGSRQWLFRAETGQALFGLESQPSCLGTALLVSGTPGTTLVQIARARLQELAGNERRGQDVVRFVDDWVLELTGALSDTFLPRDYEELTPDQEVELPPHRVAFPTKGYLWVRHNEGNSRFIGIPSLPPKVARAYLPVSRHTWLETTEASRLHAITTENFMAQDSAWSGLDHFHALVLERVCAEATRLHEQEARRLQAKADSDQAVVERALVRLSSPFQPERSAALPVEEEALADPLWVACAWVGHALGITVCRPPDVVETRAPHDPLDRIVHASHIRKRRVVLRDEWWRQDAGPLLAFVGEREFEHPVALLPVSLNRYEMLDSAQPGRTRVTREIAATIYPFAYTFYRSFPARALNIWEIWHFGLRDSQKDLATLLLMGVLGGTLGLLVPIATGWLFDELIPDAAQSRIAQVFVALVASAIASAVFQFVSGMALLRMQIRISGTVQSAVWDRLLSLPATFFRSYSAGDLCSRAMGIDRIRRELSGTTISTVLGSVFSVFNIALMFYYSPRLALVGIGLAILSTAVTTLVGRGQIGQQRKLADIQGQIAGIILQFITGISKLRVAGAEGRAFAFWAKRFATQKEIDVQGQTFANGLLVFNAIYPILNAMVVFALSALIPQNSVALSAGNFVAFYAAFSQLLAAGLQASAALLAASNIIPACERIKPIIEALPEVDAVKSSPGELSGRIEIEHVSFWYHREGPEILHDVCLHIEPGEFVALVGQSGSGKSTLLRLLLGFEQPQSGTILYDGQDLRELDVRAVRRQIGVVLQTGKLMSSTLLENIIGSSLLTVEDAWKAAHLVGLDKDIEQMPMGMYTVVSTGGSTLSGGQRQRILIARAIVHRPRILIFDEATSALDNVTQAIVSKSLEHIQATRIVVAHRLSTIKQADRIFVLDKGQILQTGTFEELSQQKGLFANLAQRQVA